MKMTWKDAAIADAVLGTENSDGRKQPDPDEKLYQEHIARLEAIDKALESSLDGYTKEILEASKALEEANAGYALFPSQIAQDMITKAQLRLFKAMKMKTKAQEKAKKQAEKEKAKERKAFEKMQKNKK